jgi:hypothetical protein
MSAHPENALKTRAIASSAGLPVSGKDLFATMLDAGEIKMPDSDLHSSWLTPNFRAQPRWVSTFSGLASADLPGAGECGLLAVQRR